MKHHAATFFVIAVAGAVFRVTIVEVMTDCTNGIPLRTSCSLVLGFTLLSAQKPFVKKINDI